MEGTLQVIPQVQRGQYVDPVIADENNENGRGSRQPCGAAQGAPFDTAEYKNRKKGQGGMPRPSAKVPECLAKAFQDHGVSINVKEASYNFLIMPILHEVGLWRDRQLKEEDHRKWKRQTGEEGSKTA